MKEITKAAVVTLGCSKNEVDSEMIMGYLTGIGFELTNELSEASVIVINTCGFIKSAKEEAISTILDIAEYKQEGNLQDLIVVGCLAKRYKKDIVRDLPEVDLVIGVDEYNNFDEIFSKYFNLKHSNLNLDFKKRIISTKFPIAYIRIADGCNNNCNYCAIPLIRGKLKSREIDDIYEEALQLVNKGIKEINVIAQDTTSYGIDLYGKPMLTELLRKLSTIDNLKWIRVLYMYPGKINDELLNEIKNNKKICKYFDIPIQHISDNMLKAMNRHTNKQETYNLLRNIRKQIPDAIIRTTVMVGFQGETIQDFDELLECMKDIKFDRLGAFTFSKEDDTVAEKMLGDVPQREKNRRYNMVMRTQQKILKEEMPKRLGKIYEVLVEDVSEDEKYFECRSYMDAPDVDPKIYLPIEYRRDVIVGEYYTVKLVDIAGYDYIAKLIEEE